MVVGKWIFKMAIAKLIGEYGHQAKCKDHWNEIIKTMSAYEHVEFLDEFMRGNPELKVRMLSVCEKKIQEHIQLKEAYKIFHHIFEEYGQRALQAEKNEGIDWKATQHAVRVCEEAKELLLTGNITFPRPEKDLLLKIRKGELHYKQVAELIEQGMADLLIAQEKSILPKEPNVQFMQDFIYDCYKNVIINNE